MAILQGQANFDYRILVSRSHDRPTADLYGFNLIDRIPAFPLPLKSPDPEPIVDLNQLLAQVYERGGYEVVIDYGLSPVPPLNREQTDWLDALLKNQGVR